MSKKKARVISNKTLEKVFRDETVTMLHAKLGCMLALLRAQKEMPSICEMEFYIEQVNEASEICKSITPYLD